MECRSRDWSRPAGKVFDELIEYHYLYNMKMWNPQGTVLRKILKYFTIKIFLVVSNYKLLLNIYQLESFAFFHFISNFFFLI